MFVDLLNNLKLDCIFVTDPANIRFLSSFTGEGYLLLTKDINYLITDSRYLFSSQKETDGFIIKLNENDVFSSVFSGSVKKRVGFENNSCSYSFYKKILRIDCADLLELNDSLNNLRISKNENEISLIKKAVSIGDLTFNAILNDIKVGITELELAAKIDYYMKSFGAEDNSFNTIVASGVNSSMPHAVPGRKKINYNEFIVFDFGCKYKGYCSDMSRTVFVGTPSNEQKNIYNIVKLAKDQVEESACLGMSGKEIDAIARRIIDRAGYGKDFLHSTGHGVGLKIHEKPYISPKSNVMIAQNSIFSVEPGIYLKNSFGVRIEDLCVMTETGIDVLSNSNCDMICI